MANYLCATYGEQYRTRVDGSDYTSFDHTLIEPPVELPLIAKLTGSIRPRSPMSTVKRPVYEADYSLLYSKFVRILSAFFQA